ncbi:hypothetical protein AA103196_0030 [Ameyamaea chiangmaiensis NBRC 103196]|uniref:Uncharacterized protein n=1 Tax=Ameyamaea chiangmaiensis TaxID=442969 RepID=A0A850PG37_9PROT|nr:hypothetical protein [Ameyamaea chiangmaiensis]GBQ61462.1 hypothetical protein AA103196_0030 [Ameyamaea chiangmaiensis NBRC 103196]
MGQGSGRPLAGGWTWQLAAVCLAAWAAGYAVCRCVDPAAVFGVQAWLVAALPIVITALFAAFAGAGR